MSNGKNISTENIPGSSTDVNTD